jgi:serine/threonine protein kinase
LAALTQHETTAALLAGRFADVRLLHSGTWSSLYAAREADTGRRVAVKVPESTDPARPQTSWTNEAIVREAAVLHAAGEHPHLVTLLDELTLRDGRRALVLERCAGSLADLTGLSSGQHPAASAVVSMGIKLCGALDAVHRAGYLHTDVSPANVYLTEWGEPVLAGFDEAVPLDPQSLAAYTLHEITPQTAPELIEGGSPTHATDVYGLAVTLFELAAGQPAFPAYAGSRHSGASLRILQGNRAALPADVPIEVGDLFAWALAVLPSARPPSIAWFAEELARVERHQGWPRTPRSPDLPPPTG